MVMYRATSNGQVEITAEEESALMLEQFEHEKEKKLRELNAAYDAAIHADITHNTKTYACDESKLNIISRFSSLNAVPGGMYIEATDGEAGCNDTSRFARAWFGDSNQRVNRTPKSNSEKGRC